MIKYKKLCCVLGVMCSVVIFSGCGKTNTAGAETPYYTMAIDGTKLYKTADDEDVKKLSEIGLKYVDFSVDFDYQALDHAFDELDFYTNETREVYVDYEYIEYFVDTKKYYEQVQELVDSNITEIKIYELNGVPKALVKCEYISRLKHVTDEYLEDVGVKLNTKYKRTMSIFFVIEDGEWKIDDYDITARVEVE